MLIARLENQILLYYQMDDNWCVVDKMEDIEVPNSVQAIKGRAIKDYVNPIKYFEVPNFYIHKVSLSHHECIPT